MSFEATPVQVKLMDTLCDGESRIVGFGGGIRGTKTFGSLASIVAFARIFPKSRWAVVRKDLERLRKNTLPSFEKLVALSGGFVSPVNQQRWEADCANGSKIILFGENVDKDPELDRWKGLEVNGFVLEEADEIKERSFIKAIERAGAWIVPDGEQPPPFVISTFNPNPHWPKRRFYLPWKMGTIAKPYAFIPTTAADNPYISDEQRQAWKEMPEHEYRRFVLGDWDSLTGAYYDTLDLTPGTGHVVDAFKPPAHWRFWGSYDWGYGHWAVMQAWATDEDGIDYLLDSVWLRRTQDEDQANAFLEELPQPCMREVYAGHDCWSVVTARGASGETTAEIFAKKKIILVKADIDKVNGGRATNRQLANKRVKIMRTRGNMKGVDQLGEIMPDENDIRKPGKVDADAETGEGGDDWADCFRYGLATRVRNAKLPSDNLPDHKQPNQAAKLKVQDGKLVKTERPPKTIEEMVEWAAKRQNGNGRLPHIQRTPTRR